MSVEDVDDVFSGAVQRHRRNTDDEEDEEGVPYLRNEGDTFLSLLEEHLKLWSIYDVLLCMLTGIVYWKTVQIC